MAGASDYLEVQIRKHLLRTGSLTKPTALYFALWIGDPLDTGAGGAEVTGGSYARVNLPPLDANWSAPDSTGGVSQNQSDITMPSPTANWGTVTHFAIFDAISGGNMLFSGALGVARVINSGDTAPVFPANSITITFA